MPITAFTTQKYPSSTSTANGSGSNGSWSNPANVYADDGSNASAAYLLDLSGMSSVPLADLIVKGFGYAIPSNAVIDGIKLEVEIVSSNRLNEANGLIKLMKAGSAVGSNKAGTASVSSGVWSYGGATDLWGTTWTPADINNANFGVDLWYTVTSSPADFQISIDYVRVTVYWHYSVDVAPADVPKTHLYKVFNGGSYLGNLPKVTSKFGYNLDINSVGSSITIECGVSADTSGQTGNRLVTEAGDPITDEDGNYLYTDGQPPVLGVGNSVDPYIFQNGNRIEVWEYSYYYPNGKLMFKGQINRIEAGFGDPGDNKIKLLVLSNGLDLDNYIARGAPFSYTADVTQNTQNTYATVSQMGGKGAGWNRYGQTWMVGAGVTKLGAITLMLGGAADVTVTVYDGLVGSALGSVTQAVNTGGGPAVVQFGLASLITVAPGSTYFFAVSVGDGQSINIYCASGNPYANGAMYNSNYGGGSGGGGYYIYSSGNYDLYFIASAGLPTTSATYTLKDPTTEILKPIIDDYRLRGGLLNYSSSSVDATGLALTVGFNTETILDALKKVLSVSPSGYYFYVDIATDTIYFKNTLTTPTYKLIKGRHLNKIDLVMSIENVKNDILFSGATVSGTNLYTEYADPTSKTLYGQRLDRKSDNRVSIQPTADAIGNSALAASKGEYYETPVTVLDKTMDITLFKPGQTVGLRGFGSFVDGLKLQIVRVEYQPGGHAANLILGNMPLRFTTEFEKAIRGLLAEQTVANPSAPS